MNKYTIGYYHSGKNNPVDDFVESKGAAAAAKIDQYIEQLKIHGPMLHAPYAKKLTGNIFELRPGIWTGEYRLFYFWHGNKAIFVHAIDRKEMKQRDIKLAEKRRTELMPYLK